MSIVMNMSNGSFGGGGAGSATIHMNVPINSTIELVYNHQVQATIPYEEQIPNIDGETADYYHTTTLLGTWTINLDNGIDDIRSHDIAIIANREYYIQLNYKNYLIKNSVFKVEFTRLGVGRIFDGNHFGATDTEGVQYYTPFYKNRETIMHVDCPKVWSLYSANQQPSMYIRTDAPNDRNNFNNTLARAMLNNGSTSRICRTTDVHVEIDISSIPPGNYFFSIAYAGYWYSDGSLPANEVDIEVTNWYIV